MGFAVNILGNCWAKINLQKLLASSAEIFLPRSLEFNGFLALLPKHQVTGISTKGVPSCQQGKMGDWKKLLKSPSDWIGTT